MTDCVFPAREINQFRADLLRWFAAHQRALPWRETRDPYRIWVSEIMLQQTRVAAVIPYYQRFLERFPDFHALARALEPELLAHWAGLGYYCRARNLQQAARRMSERGSFPSTYDEIRALPGVGDYTAAAIASIAFDLPHAAVDGNALRVLSRVTADPSDITSPAARKPLVTVANRWLDRRCPGDFNQAMMELGASICLPRSPQCARCPLSRYCQAYQTGRPEHYPVKSTKVQRREVAETLFYIERRGTILFWRRDAASKR